MGKIKIIMIRIVILIVQQPSFFVVVRVFVWIRYGNDIDAVVVVVVVVAAWFNIY